MTQNKRRCLRTSEIVIVGLQTNLSLTVCRKSCYFDFLSYKLHVFLVRGMEFRPEAWNGPRLTPGAGVGGIGQSKERILENLSTFPRENQENEIDINI